MPHTAKLYPFEGRVTQFLPGRTVCFVTLSTPIGSVKRAMLHTERLSNDHIDATTLKIEDHVSGKLLVSDAAVAEIVELN